MADKASETNTKSLKGPFAYTSGKYWEGSAFPFWVYMLLTVLPTGFFGIDHLLFHSPQTALQKGIVNIFTLGFWYFYDILQVFADRDYVNQYGLSRPVVGPTGLAHQYFTNVVPPEQQKEPDLPSAEAGKYSSLYLAFYLFLIFLPFGIPNFLIGDTSGGVIKFIFTILFFGMLVPIVLLCGAYELYMAVSNPTQIFEKGIKLTIPFSWFVGTDHLAPNLMKPSALKAAEAAESTPKGSLLTRILQPFLDYVGLSTITQMLGAAKCAAEPVLDQAQKTVNAATTAASGVTALAGTVPKVATQVTGTLQAFTDPEKLKAAAATAASTAAGVQAGGGILSAGELDSIFFISIGVLLLGAIGLSAVRWLRNINTQKNDKPPQSESNTRNDTPPQPGNL